jgi:hypothetical protein
MSWQCHKFVRSEQLDVRLRLMNLQRGSERRLIWAKLHNELSHEYLPYRRLSAHTLMSCNNSSLGTPSTRLHFLCCAVQCSAVQCCAVLCSEFGCCGYTVRVYAWSLSALLSACSHFTATPSGLFHNIYGKNYISYIDTLGNIRSAWNIVFRKPEGTIPHVRTKSGW